MKDKQREMEIKSDISHIILIIDLLSSEENMNAAKQDGYQL
jgi:hypothetical protein